MPVQHCSTEVILKARVTGCVFVSIATTTGTVPLFTCDAPRQMMVLKRHEA